RLIVSRRVAATKTFGVHGRGRLIARCKSMRNRRRRRVLQSGAGADGGRWCLLKSSRLGEAPPGGVADWVVTTDPKAASTRHGGSEQLSRLTKGERVIQVGSGSGRRSIWRQKSVARWMSFSRGRSVTCN